jgi:hypothetical protein
VFDFTTVAGVVHAVNAKYLRAVSLSGPGGQGEGQVGLFGDGFVISSGDIPQYSDAVTLYSLWRQRMDDFS